MRLNKIFRFILTPLKHIIGLGWGECESCGFHWNIVDSHSVYVKNGKGCFAVCEDCWNTKSDEEIITAFCKLYDRWLSGDEYNSPFSEETIGYSKKELINAVKKALKERNIVNTDYIMPENTEHRKQRGRTAPNRALSAWDDKNYFENRKNLK